MAVSGVPAELWEGWGWGGAGIVLYKLLMGWHRGCTSLVGDLAVLLTYRTSVENPLLLVYVK